MITTLAPYAPMHLGTYASFLLLLTLRLRTYLHPFQQEEYDAIRLIRWWWEKKAFDRWASLGLLALAPLAVLPHPALYLVPCTLYLLFRAFREPNPTKTGKKPLVMTPRARNIWLLASLLATAALAATARATEPLSSYHPIILSSLLFLQLSPLFLLAANALLRPVQLLQNRRYLAEAHSILSRLKPTTIGITGSFGKTSTKYILNQLLTAQGATLMTPGSINTPLGIARIVREQLLPQHQYFIAEMGAYGPGSIARLCKLAPPSISCITAVGEAHYERFKSLETVAKAKFEIAEATLANGGICLLAADSIPAHLWQPFVAQNPTKFRLISTRPEVVRSSQDYLLESAGQTADGLHLTIVHNSEKTALSAPIYGTAQLSNLALAFALATELGVPTAALAAAMRTVPPAPHRLHVQRQGLTTVIDDSYNSNPKGFASALEVLSLLAERNGGRRILVTPGMVELGAHHDEEHSNLGHLAAKHADITLAVNPSRIPTFIKALRESGAEVHEVPTLTAARDWLQKNGHPNDIILLENDLPDRYEARWNL